MINFVIVSDNLDAMTQNTITSIQTKIPFTVDVMGFKRHGGYNAALNAAIKEGNGEIIAACNNDLVFHSGAIEELVKALNKFDSVSPWCPKTHYEYGWSQKPGMPVEGYQIGKIIAGWCIFMRRSAWERITWNEGGVNCGFDERLKFWACDNAYAEQLKQAKLSHALIPSAKVTHLQSQTLKTQPTEVYRKLTKFELDKFYKLYPNRK